MNNSSNSGKSCIAHGCPKNINTASDLKYFKLPKDPERCRKWLNIINREDLLEKDCFKYYNYEVCSLHFDDSAFEITKHLKVDAVPSRHLCYDDDLQIIESTTPSKDKLTNVNTKARSTTPYLNPTAAATQVELPPRSETGVYYLSERNTLKRKSVENLQDPKRKRSHEFDKIKKQLESQNTTITNKNYINKKVDSFLKWQNKLKLKANHAIKDTISRLILKVPPKIDSRILESLSIKIKSLPEKAKFCTICVDKMKLKRNLYYNIKRDEMVGFHNINGKISPEVASSAYVVMLQGLYFEWNQPIAYIFKSSNKQYVELDSWINDTIAKLFSTGFEVKAFISDQGSYFSNYAEVIKKVTINNPYFFINQRKVYYIYDIPHLLKRVRNELLSSNFHYNGEVISWDYIKMLYEDQKAKDLTLLPKITDAHIEPNNFQRRRFKYAAQIFSNSVYTALQTYIDFEKIPQDAKATATFIKTMDDLLDVLNNSCKIKSVKKLRSVFVMSEQQETILNKAQNIFANIKSINRHTGQENADQVKVFKNFQISIQSIQQMFEDLNEEGFQHLFTRRLNLDNLENFFKSVRRQNGCRFEPTPIRFTRTFSKLCVTHMLQDLSFANCKSNFYDVLLKVENVLKRKTFIPNYQTSLVLLNSDTDYRMDLPKGNPLPYIASYLIFKCSRKHDCTDMQRKINLMPSLYRSASFAHYKMYNTHASYFGNLKEPTIEIVQYVVQLENVFADNFDKCITRRVGSKMFKLLKTIPPAELCSCFPTDYFLKLFVRLRIFTTIKFNNRCFKSAKKTNELYFRVEQL